MNNIKVSVIVPVYNQEQYIGATLYSIIHQDFDNFEIVVVDDGSTDNSLDIIINSLQNSKIPHKIIQQENAGVSVARNVGIDESQGDYIVFVDGDDYITSKHLSNMYNGVTDFSLTQLVKKRNDDIISKPHTYTKEITTAEDLIKMELNMEIPFNFCQLMYKSKIIKQNNIKFPKNIIYGEDTAFALKALIYGETVTINNEVTYFYIQHPTSAVQTSKFRRFEIVEVFEKLEKFYRKNKKDKLADLIITSRIPRAIFGNMNFFFHNGYDFDETFEKMQELNLLDKLSKFEGDKKFKSKIKLFLLNPKLYYKMWMKFKNSID